MTCSTRTVPTSVGSASRARASFASRTLALTALVITPIFPGCDCNVTEIDAIAPTLAVDACASPDIQFQGISVGGVEDCALAFGTRDISVRTEQVITLTNPSSIELTIDEIFFTDDSDPSFQVKLAPEKIGPGLTVEAVVTFRPNFESSVDGTLIIRSDAENTPQANDRPQGEPFSDLPIPVSGTGVDNGLPDISITPEECDFGRVARGGVAQCSLTVENLGNKTLVLDSVTFVDDLVKPNDSELESFGFFGRPPSENDAIPAPPDEGSVANISVRFSPDVLGGYTQTLRFLSNDPDTPEILVPLSGVGVDPPECAVKVAAVNGTPASAAPTIEPLDDVMLTAEDSEASVVGGTISSVAWEIIDRPPGSTVSLTDPAGINTQFTFADGVLGVDLAGRYRIRATVIDDLGTSSVNECELNFEAIPTDTILTQLSWDTSFGDMDLHLMKADDQGRYCGASAAQGGLAESCGTTSYACYYANCKATSGNRPDWDDDGENGTEGDPSLDIDDLCGFGPENINIDLAAPGSYLVGVDFFGFTGCSGSGAVGNTLRLYLYGALQAEFYRDMENGDWWEPAIIHWPGVDQGVPCIEDLGTTELECPDDA